MAQHGGRVWNNDVVLRAQKGVCVCVGDGEKDEAFCHLVDRSVRRILVAHHEPGCDCFAAFLSLFSYLLFWTGEDEVWGR